MLRSLRFLLFLGAAAVPVSGSLMGFAYLAPTPWQYDLREIAAARPWGSGTLDGRVLAQSLFRTPALTVEPETVEDNEDQAQGAEVLEAEPPVAGEAMAETLSVSLEPALQPDGPPRPAAPMREGGTLLPDTYLASLLAATATPAREPLKPLAYRVVPGDSLVKIAASFGITPETVLWANDLGNGEMLQIGQELTILPVSGVLHMARRGDTPASVAESYATDLDKLLRANLLAPSDPLREGQTLIVPGGMRRTAEFPGLPTPPSAQELAAAPRYTVAAGDTLVSIADAFGVQPSVIQVANNLMDPDLLKVGAELSIPGGKAPAPVTPTSSPATTPTTPPVPTATQTPAPTATPVPSPTPAPAAPAPAAPAGSASYVVKPGDTLYAIGRSFGVSPASIQQANGLGDSSALRVGQSLSVPGGSQPPAAAREALPTATSTPTPVPATPTPMPTAQPAKPTTAPTTPLVGPPAPPQPTKTPAPAAAPPVQAVPPLGSGSRGDQIAALAQKYLGYRYVWGGHSTTGFDCSGFTWFIYREVGLSIPAHDLGGQLNAGQKVAKDKLLPGDLVFFENTYKPGLSHVGIYLGGGRFINAESEAVGVQIRGLADPVWSTRYVGASRPW